jgi:uncharacterized repeat protein (TIGR01451 family)
MRVLPLSYDPTEQNLGTRDTRSKWCNRLNLSAGCLHIMNTRHRLPLPGLTVLLMLIGVIGAIAPAMVSEAVELPPAGSPIFIQTNGPEAPINLGDWYSSRHNGIGGAYHYVAINVPCRWPADLPFHIDLYSPEVNSFPAVPPIDEITSHPLSKTVFELYSPDTPLVLPNQPGPGAAGSLTQQQFAPITDRPDQWMRFYTLTPPVRCGSYVLRIETTGDEQNGWRLRFGSDDDNDPQTTPPPSYDNPDRHPGTGDEPTLGISQVTYQHNQPGETRCMILYQFVHPGATSAAFHNFDMDNNVRVRYYPSGVTFDPQGLATPGSIAGTVSGYTVWNGGTQTDRGSGDLIQQPQAGWWRIVTCVRDDNQFNQEGQHGIPTYRDPFPEPDVIVAKDDGRELVYPGEILTYTIRIENRSLQTRAVPGAAFDLVLTDTLPTGMTYRTCAWSTPGLNGTCYAQGQDVVFRLADPLVAGAVAIAELSTLIDANAQGHLTNTVRVDYSDIIGNGYPPATSSDTDRVPQAMPALDAFKTATLVQDRNGDGIAGAGDTVAYTITVANDGAAPAFGLQVDDTPDPHTSMVAGSLQVDPPSATILAGDAPTDTSVAVLFDRIDPHTTVRVSFQVLIADSLPPNLRSIANQALISSRTGQTIPSDDPATPVPDDPTIVPLAPPPAEGPPTAISLSEFRAEVIAHRAVLVWITGSEIDTQGFWIERSPDADRATARRLNPNLIPARGSTATETSYVWSDPEPLVGVGNYYWLIEHDRFGQTSVYGPLYVGNLSLNRADRLFLPLVLR